MRSRLCYDLRILQPFRRRSCTNSATSRPRRRTAPEPRTRRPNPDPPKGAIRNGGLQPLLVRGSHHDQNNPLSRIRSPAEGALEGALCVSRSNSPQVSFYLILSARSSMHRPFLFRTPPLRAMLIACPLAHSVCGLLSKLLPGTVFWCQN